MMLKVFLFLLPLVWGAEEEKPTLVFDAKDPLLILGRDSKIPWPKNTTFNCKAALKSFSALLNEGSLNESADSFKPWDPWKEEDAEAAESCDDFPCDFKLNKAEVERMKAKTKTERKAELLQLVRERVGGYAKTQERKEYEFPGDPVDPWGLQDRESKSLDLKRPAAVQLKVRKIDLLEKKVRSIRQILDRRYAERTQPKGGAAAIWIRDAYTAHYFDSWGELHTLNCSDATHTLQLSQQLILELDLLKKTDLISKIGRPSMRKNIREYGEKYLADVQERLVKTF